MSPTKFYHDSNYIVDVAIQPKFGNPRIERSYHIYSQFYKDLTRKNFFRGLLLIQVLLRPGTRYGLEILHLCGKRVKNKSFNLLN